VYLIFAMVGASEQETWKRDLLLRFWRASLPVHFREVQHDRDPTGSLARATQEERESERSQISQKDFGWRNAGAVERRARAD